MQFHSMPHNSALIWIGHGVNTAPEGQPHCAPGGPGGRCAGSPSWPPHRRRKGSGAEMCVLVCMGAGGGGAPKAIDQQLAMEG